MSKLLGVLILLLLCFPVATAVDFSGTIPATGPASYHSGAGGAPNVMIGGTNTSCPWWTDFSNVGVPNYYIMYDEVDQRLVGSTIFTMNDTAGEYATGTFQALNGTFSPSTRKQYYLLTFTSWNPGSRTGIVAGTLKLPDGAKVAEMGGLSLTYGALGGGLTWSAGVGNVTMGGGDGIGVTKRVLMGGVEEYGEAGTAIASYNVTRVSGMGDVSLARINVIKNSDNNLASNIRVLSSPGGYTTYYASPWTDKDGIEVIDVVGNNYYIQSYVAGLGTKRWNTSVITFTGPAPTPTPTPLPTGAVPSGYTRTTVFATDGSTGGTILGATLGIKDVEAGTWTNATSTIEGTNVDVLTNHTLDIYGSYPGVYSASYELGATPGGNYYLPLLPPIPEAPGGLTGGYANLIINTFDAGTNNMLPNVGVTARLPTGAETGDNTGSAGTAYFLVPNNTVIILGASVSGYSSISQSVNSGTGADKIVNMRLTRSVVTTAPVTPVVTDPGTGAIITPLPTIDARTDNEKDVDLMNQIRDSAPNIVGLGIVVILFGLLKMLMKF